jgi:glycolate dehydrogenase FAD-binding subunit
MDLTSLCGLVAGAKAAVPVGARTQWEVGNPVDGGTEVHAPAGVVRYEPEDMTVTVGAGISYAALDRVLAEHGQECPLDPRDTSATVGGVLACGLSGPRRLRHGPVREHLLEVPFVTADGRVVKGGGPTVKNVTGYDLPRLMVGSFGTLGVLAQVTLRCRPRPVHAQWFVSPEVRATLYRPAAMLWDGRVVHILCEGDATDVAAQTAELQPSNPPSLPDGPHRGRISVAPGRLDALVSRLDTVRWCAELGVGTVHVAADTAADLRDVRDAARAHGGWMLREAGGDGIDGFGRPLPNLALMQRIKAAFDPTGKLAPGKLPLGPSAPDQDVP